MHLNKIFSFPECLSAGSLILPNELHAILPLTEEQSLFIERARQTIKEILARTDKRLLLIVGPCSIHDVDSALDYASRLKALSQTISDTFFVVMRVYLEKPRTAVGWKGLAFDPYLDGSYDITKGLFLSRQLLLALTDLQIPIATEFLEPAFNNYYSDLVSWGCVGARTAESQTHRQMASGFSMPIGFKNNTSGNVEVAVNGIFTASNPHTFMSINKEGMLSVMRTEGNCYSHLVLRGGTNKPNYDAESIKKAVFYLRQVRNSLGLLIDCSHDNSSRQHEKQLPVFHSVINQIIQGNKNIRGLCLESHINEGNQLIEEGRSKLKYGISITDPCIDWETTQSLVMWGCSKLKNYFSLLLCLLILNSCASKDTLSAFTEYVTREQLASYIIGTPDPALNSPPVGQKLYISWNLPLEYNDCELFIKLKIRFKDKSEIEEWIKINKRSGTYVYALLNKEYFNRKGFLSYKIELYGNDLLIKEWCHQMWVEIIKFPNEEDCKDAKAEGDEELD